MPIIVTIIFLPGQDPCDPPSVGTFAVLKARFGLGQGAMLATFLEFRPYTEVFPGVADMSVSDTGVTMLIIVHLKLVDANTLPTVEERVLG